MSIPCLRQLAWPDPEVRVCRHCFRTNAKDIGFIKL
uniref:Uncharacterized protein n=1 Tax=Aegilops tauschii subsp. strangulata TaxID=200361 RepID=A0A453GLE7_AEGTS